MKKFLPLLLLVSCYHSTSNLEPAFVSIQIQDRNGMTETISQPEKLESYAHINFLDSQPYKKIIRIYRQQGKQSAIVISYHPNGLPWQYLEAQDMRAFGSFKEWHSNGRLKIEANVIGGTADVAPSGQKNWLFDGLAEVWDERGARLAQITYSKGVLEGRSLHYYPNGQLKKEETYLQNELEGEAIEYFPDGKIASKTHYANGIKQGSSVGHYPNQAIQWSEDYQNGRLTEGQYYSSDGTSLAAVQAGNGFQALFNSSTLEKLIEVQNGESGGVVKTFYPNGDLKVLHRIKNGLKQGEEIEYYPSKTAKISVPWEANAISGIVKTWYPDGTLQSQREMARNKKSGASLAWYRDGSLMYMEEYEDDHLHSGQYFKKGNKEPISSVANGTGLAMLYDELGIFLRKVQYQKGKPVDPET
jgi:antitoxin component YwqK of YwqJK toxin-antitoxin module